MRDVMLEMERQIQALAKEVGRLRAVQVSCRWRGSSAGAPANPIEGDLYFDTGTALVYVYANSGWVQIS